MTAVCRFISLKLLESLLHMLGADLEHLGQGRGGKRVMGGAVDLARQALGGLE